MRYLKGLEIFGHDASKLGDRVLPGLFILLQSLLDASPQDDHDLQQMGRDGRVFPQQRISLLRSNSKVNLHKLRHALNYSFCSHFSEFSFFTNK